MKRFAVSVAALALLAGPALAQTPPPAGPNCLFPLACPGPVPPKPEPLLGPPEDPAAAAQPAETTKPKHHARKHVVKAKAKAKANAD